MLALAAVLAQQLVPGVDGVMQWPATEIMIATDAVRVASAGILKERETFGCASNGML